MLSMPVCLVLFNKNQLSFGGADMPGSQPNKLVSSKLSLIMHDQVGSLAALSP